MTVWVTPDDQSERLYLCQEQPPPGYSRAMLLGTPQETVSIMTKAATQYYVDNWVWIWIATQNEWSVGSIREVSVESGDVCVEYVSPDGTRLNQWLAQEEQTDYLYLMD